MSNEIDLPKTLDPSGAVPTSRMNDAKSTMIRVGKLIDNDNQGRAQRRTLAKGLVDGNAPYKKTALRNAGRGDACNVNWRQAEALLSESQSAFYDTFSESETYATIELELDSSQHSADKSKIATAEWDRMLKEDEGFDSTVQTSQESMVLYGRGPLMFSDLVDWRPSNVQDRDFLVPDKASSNVTKWEELCILSDMSPSDLYTKIKDSEIATQAGWSVEVVKKAIINATSSTDSSQEQRSWEYWQERLKTQSQLFNDDSMLIRIAHYFVKEFAKDDEEEGKISHTIVLAPDSSASETIINEFLFKNIGQFDSWKQFVHPMYYDNLGGGKHYAVTGLGQKMFSSLEFQNRLICKIADDAFMPTTLLQAGTESGADALKIIKMGPFGIIPKGANTVQSGIRGSIQEGIGLSQFISTNLSQNLSGYRTSTPQKSGNPVTAKEFQIRAGEQAQLGGTQLSRYYKQEDSMYRQMYERTIVVTSKRLPGGTAAMAFIKRCSDKGVTKADLKKIKSVSATRIIGKGSPVMRQQSLGAVGAFMPVLPPEGQRNMVRDTISAHVGVKLVDRYYPADFVPEQSDQHNVIANLQVASMKDGVAAVVTSDQNHEVFATTFIKAGIDAINSVKEGAPPNEVLGFLELAMPAALEHIQILGQDPSTKETAAKLNGQLQQIAKLADELRKFAGQTPKQQEQGRQLSHDQQLAQQKAQGESQLDEFKVTESNKRSEQKIQQQMSNKQRSEDQAIVLKEREMRIKESESERNNGS